MTTQMHFAFRIDGWDPAGDNPHLAGLGGVLKPRGCSQERQIFVQGSTNDV
jgi:hypothetical protein